MKENVARKKVFLVVLTGLGCILCLDITENLVLRHIFSYLSYCHCLVIVHYLYIQCFLEGRAFEKYFNIFYAFLSDGSVIVLLVFARANPEFIFSHIFLCLLG